MKNRRVRDIAKLLISVLACQCAGFIGSIFTTPSIPTWYATLQKPPFTPPELVIRSCLDNSLSIDGNIIIYYLAQRNK